MDTVLMKQSAYFFNDMQNMTIKQFFNITDDMDINVYQTHLDTYLLEFKYSKNKTHYINFALLPDEISKNINSYLVDYINVIYKIKYTNCNMSPPNYSLYSIEYNIPKIHINIKKYYKYLINKHNGIYNKNWTPGVKIRVSILEIITMMMLNHFKYLFNH